MNLLDNNFSDEVPGEDNKKPENIKPEISVVGKNLNTGRFIKPRFIVPAVALFVIIAFTAGIIFAGPNFFKKTILTESEKEDRADLLAGFSKLTINLENINDNFDFRPKKFDSLGAEANSIFSLKSKVPFDTEIIKENFKLTGVEYEVNEISDQEWEIIPLEPMEPSTLVKASLETSYTDESGDEKARDFSWVYQIKDSFKILHAIPRDTGTNVPMNTGIEFTFSHDNYKDYEQFFEISPKTEGSFEKHGRTLVFVPKEMLSPGTVYTVVVKKGLPLDNSAEILGEDHSVTFETRPEAEKRYPDYYFSFQNHLANASPGKAPVFSIYSRGPIKSLNAKLYSFPGEDEFLASLEKRNKNPWWSYSSDQYIENTENLSFKNDFNLELQTHERNQYLELPELLSPGFYLLEFSFEDMKRQVWLQISDLSVYMNITKTDTLVWVNSLEAEGTINGAKTQIIGTEAEAFTDQFGVASFKTPSVLLSENNNREKNRIFFLRVSHNGESLVMPATRNSPYEYYGGYNSSAEGSDYWNYLYTDRPRYQPDDVIKFFGLLKSRDNESINETVKVTLYKEGYVDYYYRPVKIMEKEISLSEGNVFDGEFEIKNTRPDYYTLELAVGEKVIKRKYISIRPYIKPAYELTLTPEKNKVFAGETLKLKAKAAFFEGTPVPGVKLVYKTPSGEQKVITNEKGEVELEYNKSYHECSRDYSCWPSYEHLSIKPEDGELAEIYASAYINVYGPDVVLKYKTTYPDKGSARIEFETKKISLQKKAEGYEYVYNNDLPAPNAKIEGNVVKITYTKRETGTRYDFINKKTYKTYSYNRKEDVVDKLSIITDEEGKYIYERSIEPETSYRLELKVYGKDGRFDKTNLHLYYYNGNYFYRYNNSGYNYYHLEKIEEKKRYKLGERVDVRFLNNEEMMPAGNNKFLYMHLQNGLKEYRVASEAEYGFNFEAKDIPNVNLEAVYFDGRNYLKTRSGYWGFLSINFDQSERELDISISTDKDKYEPGEEVRLQVEVKDKNGIPKRSDVNLNLVDEAYYAIAEDFASPLSAIYTSVEAGSLFIAETKVADMAESMGAERGGCFAAGTMILMYDGNEKPIEKIEKGDRVMTFTDPVNRQMSIGEVTETWRHLAPGYIIINGDLKVTPEHQMFSNGRFIDAGMLKPGDWLLDHNREKVEIYSIKEIYQTIEVYNFRVDPQHTYFAGGFYVHNQEKGGGAREVFTDAALFLTVRTNNQGIAETVFTLPDNITSWRITSQAISGDLYAGVDTAQIPVSLPVFADVTVGSEYLASDKPVVKLRAYGTALSENDSVEFGVSSAGLGLEKAKTISGTAFKPSYFPLPNLNLGRHPVVYDLKTAKGDDAIKLPLFVVTSRLEAQASRDEILSVSTKIKPENDLPLTIVFSDEGQNKLYNPLHGLAWSWGDRVDQIYVRGLSRKLLNEYYGEEWGEEDFKAFNYQLSNGGISLLPYSDAELELSARIAGINHSFDKTSLAQYFFRILENRKSTREEITFALYGLASLEEAILPRIQAWLGREDLSIKERLYMAQALNDLGAGEWSRQLYYEIINEVALIKEPYAVITVKGNSDEIFRVTMLAAVLATSLRAPEADGLWRYVLDNQVLYGYGKNSENIFNIEKFKYIDKTLPLLKPSPSEVVYKLAGRETKATLTGGRIHAFNVPSREADKIEFLSVTGDVGVSTRYIEPFDPVKAERDPEIRIKREYYVDGKITNEFKENDLIEVVLIVDFGSNAIAGDYQITDILPSGLAPVTSYRYGYYGQCSFRYPYNTSGQLVKYKINSKWDRTCGSIRYLARVRTKGEYTAEPAIIQSFINPGLINYSDTQKIKID